MLSAGVIWLFYMAIEPYVRRLWPGTLVAWGRALDGQWRDPMVGRHILLGAVAGIGFSVLFSLPTLASATLGSRGTARPLRRVSGVDGATERIANMLMALQD